MKYYDALLLGFRGNRKDGLVSLYCTGQLEDSNTEGVYKDYKLLCYYESSKTLVCPRL